MKGPGYPREQMIVRGSLHSKKAPNSPWGYDEGNAFAAIGNDYPFFLAALLDLLLEVY